MFNMTVRGCVALGWLIGAAQVTSAQSMASSLGVVAYPPEGATAEQISADETHCYNWAVNNTGIDPVALANQQINQEPERRRGGQVAGGAAAGAAAGVLIGDNRQSAATGAAIGAVAGGVAGNIKGKEADQR